MMGRRQWPAGELPSAERVRASPHDDAKGVNSLQNADGRPSVQTETIFWRRFPQRRQQIKRRDFDGAAFRCFYAERMMSEEESYAAGDFRRCVSTWAHKRRSAVSGELRTFQLFAEVAGVSERSRHWHTPGSHWHTAGFHTPGLPAAPRSGAPSDGCAAERSRPTVHAVFGEGNVGWSALKSVPFDLSNSKMPLQREV